MRRPYDTNKTNYRRVRKRCFAVYSLCTSFRYSHEDMSLYYYGYVQCRPSYNEDGKHAQAGYIRYWRYDLLGNVVNDTGRLYTPYGTDQTDSRLLTKSHTYTDSIIPNPHKTQFRYGFIWQPHRDKAIPWPLPYSIGNVTK